MTVTPDLEAWAATGLHLRPDGHRVFRRPELAIELAELTPLPVRSLGGAAMAADGLRRWLDLGHSISFSAAELSPGECWCWHSYFPPMDAPPQMPPAEAGGLGGLVALTAPGSWIPLAITEPEELIALYESNPTAFRGARQAEVSAGEAAWYALAAPDWNLHYRPHPEEGALLLRLITAETPLEAAAAAIEAVNETWLYLAAVGFSRGAPAFASPAPGHIAPKATLQAACLYATTSHGTRT